MVRIHVRMYAGGTIMYTGRGSGAGSIQNEAPAGKTKPILVNLEET